MRQYAPKRLEVGTVCLKQGKRECVSKSGENISKRGDEAMCEGKKSV
jgi:hypothetical protein